MLRRLTLVSVLVFTAPAGAAVWPEQWAGYRLAAVKSVSVDDRAVWLEYGLEQAEHAAYDSEGRHFMATAYRLKDSTGALAVFQWQRPASSRPSRLAELAVETGDGAMVVLENYVLNFQGFKPKREDLAVLFAQFPRVERSALPPVTAFLPAENRIPHSERLILGPASLDQFGPRIAPSLAAFHTGAEAQLGRFRFSQSEIELAVFSYPTPHIARERLAAFQQLPGAMVKRSGPLLAVVLAPTDRDAVERLLARVTYRATVTLNEKSSTKEGNIGEMLMAIFSLTGLLLAFAVGAGLFVAAVRLVSRRWLAKSDDPMVLLHLGDK